MADFNLLGSDQKDRETKKIPQQKTQQEVSSRYIAQILPQDITAQQKQQLFQDGDLNPEYLTTIFQENGKTEEEATRLTELLTQMQTEQPNGPAHQEFQTYLNRLTEQENIKPIEPLKREDPKTYHLISAQLTVLEGKEQKAIEQGRFDIAVKYDRVQTSLILHADVIAKIRRDRGDTSAEDALRGLSMLLEEPVQNQNISPIEHSEIDTSRSKNPLHHFTQYQEAISTSLSTFWVNTFVTLQEQGATEPEIAELAEMANDSVKQTLQADAAARGLKHDDYITYIQSPPGPEREQILLDNGFNQNTLNYLDGMAERAMGTAALAAGLTFLAPMFGMSEGEEIDSSDTAATGFLNDMDLLQRQMDEQQMNTDIDEALEALKDKSEATEEGEATVASLDPDKQKELGDLGIGIETTIKEAKKRLEKIKNEYDEIQTLRSPESFVKRFNDKYALAKDTESGLLYYRNPPLYPEGEAMEIMKANMKAINDAPAQFYVLTAQEFAGDGKTILGSAFTALRGDVNFGDAESPEAIVTAYLTDPQNEEKKGAFQNAIKDPKNVGIRAALMDAFAEAAIKLGRA